MPKRGSENGQMRREDYEAAMSSGRGGGEDSGPFKRASASQMAKRRVVKSRRPAGAAKTPQPDRPSAFAGFSFAPAPATVASSKPGGGGGAGGGFSFTAAPPKDAPAKSVGFATGSTPPAAAVGASKSVGFSFGGSTPAPPAEKTSTAGATPFVFGGPSPAASTPGGFSFSTTSPPAPSTGGFAFGGSTSSGVGGGLVARFQKKAIEMEKSFHEECATVPLSTTNLLPILDLYLDAVYCLESEYWKRADASQDKPKKAAVSISFGAPGASIAPPAQPGGGGFLFGGSSAAKAPPTPAAPTPAAAASETSSAGGPSDTLSDVATKASGGGADDGWTGLGESDGHVTIYYSKSGGKAARVARGIAKFQQNENTKKKRVIVRDETTGAVRVNFTLQGDIKPSYSTQAHKKYIQGVEKALFPSKMGQDEEKPGTVLIAKPVQPGLETIEKVMQAALNA